MILKKALLRQEIFQRKAAQHHRGALEILKPHHGSGPPLDGPAIQFNSVFKAFPLPDPDRTLVAHLASRKMRSNFERN